MMEREDVKEEAEFRGMQQEGIDAGLNMSWERRRWQGTHREGMSTDGGSCQA